MSWLATWLLLLWFLDEKVDTMRRCEAGMKADACFAKTLCTDYGYILKEAQFTGKKYWLCLKPVRIGDSPVASQDMRLLLNPDIAEPSRRKSLKESTVSHHHIHMVYGFPLENPDNGSAEGYIGMDRHFYGVLHLDGRTLHADPRGYDVPGLRHGSYVDDHVTPPPPPPLRPRRGDTQLGMFPEHLPYTIRHEKRRPAVASARVCDLLLMADKEFYERDANSSLDQVVLRMMHAVAQADIVFRNADFNDDGVPDNIGFSVKYILVLISNTTNERVFGDLLSTEDVDGKSYLMKFARVRRLSDVCLGIAFSGHGFHNKTLGLSFTSLGGGMSGAAGGLCDRRAYGRSFNTLALAHASHAAAARVPERVAALTLAHELGHSFGAHHDDNFPNPECRGYLMGSHSSTSNSSKHYQFSVCSKRQITATLASMSYCLVEEDKPYCGNGIVEEGEACDCGLPSKCYERDPCCTPRAGGALVFDEGALHKEGCSVAPAAECHPSQGLCCTAKCKYANLKAYGIECEYQSQPCACADDEYAICRCGLGGRCLAGGCHAAECARLGLPECQCEAGDERAARSEREEVWCTACCRLGTESEGSCVPAATAAIRTLLDSTRDVPDDWADEDYVGPNITIRLCATCPKLTLRAWPPRAPCVTRNTVGACARGGVCAPARRQPQSNVYPLAMAMDLTIRRPHRPWNRKSHSVPTSCPSALCMYFFILIIPLL